MIGAFSVTETFAIVPVKRLFVDKTNFLAGWIGGHVIPDIKSMT